MPLRSFNQRMHVKKNILKRKRKLKKTSIFGKIFPNLLFGLELYDNTGRKIEYFHHVSFRTANDDIIHL